MLRTVSKIKIGDLVTFKLRYGRDASYMRKSTRKVRIVREDWNKIAVSFVGYQDFWIEAREILEVKHV
jgi:hypothetical protein